MNVQLTEECFNLIQNIAESNGIRNYETDCDSSSFKGENYLGTIVKLTIKNNEKKISAILKIASTNESFRKNTRVRDIFLREIYMYETIFPAFEKFQLENGQYNGFKGYPKFFGKLDENGKEALVLENLIDNGYKLWNKKIPMDSSHVSAVMREYAKFHAVSFAMRQKNPHLFQDLVSKHVSVPLKPKDVENRASLVRNVAVMVPRAVEGNAVLEKALKKFVDEGKDFFVSLGQERETMVVRHGDCWCNNILFKYEDLANQTNPTKVSFIDFQLSKLGVPTTDLGYFLLTNGSKEILKDHKKYLKTYYDSLTESLETMAVNPEEVYPYATFERQWKKYAKFGFFLAPVIFRISAIGSQEVPEMDEGIESTDAYFEKLINAGHLNPQVVTNVNQKLADTFQFLVENELV